LKFSRNELILHCSSALENCPSKWKSTGFVTFNWDLEGLGMDQVGFFCFFWEPLAKNLHLKN